MGNLDIRNFKLGSNESSFELYVGFNRWTLLTFKKNGSSISLPDIEDIVEEYDLEDAYDDLEEIVDGVIKIMSSVLNVLDETDEK